MKKCLSVLVLSTFLLFIVNFPTTFAQARNPAKPYVEQALEQMGGISRLEAIKTARLEYWGHRYLLEESERPEALGLLRTKERPSSVITNAVPFTKKRSNGV